MLLCYDNDFALECYKLMSMTTHDYISLHTQYKYFLNEPQNIMKFENAIKQAEHMNIIEHLCQ